jgi:hypothetical protein
MLLHDCVMSNCWPEHPTVSDEPDALLTGWVVSSGAASFRICDRFLPKHGLKVQALDNEGLLVFKAGFNSVNSLADALQQPCWQVGLTCRVEDDVDGKAVVMRRLTKH